MARFQTSRTIAAPPETVFDTVAHIDRFSEAIPNVTSVEFLSETRRGIGTRFRETRLMRGRPASTELEITDYIVNERVRFVSEAGGSTWDTTFTVRPDGDATHLDMVMEATPRTLVAKVTTAVFGRMVATAIESDMDAVKAYCEAN